MSSPLPKKKRANQVNETLLNEHIVSRKNIVKKIKRKNWLEVEILTIVAKI